MTVADVVTAAADARDTAWEAGSSAGALVVAWQHPGLRAISPVGLLEHGRQSGYRFRYLARAADVEGFRPFLGFPRWERTYKSDDLFPIFAQRVMSPRRPDYVRFIAQLNLDVDASPWEQLVRSEGRSSGDTVQLFPVPVVDADRTTTCLFLVHGIRHVVQEQFPELASGDALELQDDATNPVNEDAALVCTLRGEKIGYVPDLLVEHVRALQRARPVRLTAEHVNGPDAPLHLRVLVRLTGEAPVGYRPMSGPAWRLFGE